MPHFPVAVTLSGRSHTFRLLSHFPVALTRSQAAKKMEVEWQNRHADVVQLVSSLEKSGKSPANGLTSLLQKWEVENQLAYFAVCFPTAL